VLEYEATLWIVRM